MGWTSAAYTVANMTSATIKLHLPSGDAKSLRIAEISNWTGKAIAAPRTELDDLLRREELEKAGIYILLGTDPQTNAARAYIGEAEVLRDRLRQHRNREFWISAILFTSKDENLTKAHVKYLESELLREALEVNRFLLDQNQTVGCRLPESDLGDMRVFLSHIRQLLPVLGSDILIPIVESSTLKQDPKNTLICRNRGAEARGQRTASGFVILRGSTAVSQERGSIPRWVVELRQKLIENGSLTRSKDLLAFSTPVEFASPSAAAAVVYGGTANGLTAWRTESGVSLKQLDERE